MIRRLTLACALAGLVLAGAAGCKSAKQSTVAPAPAKNLDVAKLLDQTKLPNLKDQSAGALASYMGAKGLMMVFLDTTCPYSGAALKDMPAVIKTLGAAGISSIVVNVDEAKAAVEKHYAATPPGTTLVYDTSTGTRKAWEVTSVPTVVVVTAGKALAYYGPAVWKDMAAAAEGALGLPAGTLAVQPAGTGST